MYTLNILIRLTGYTIAGIALAAGYLAQALYQAATHTHRAYRTRHPHKPTKPTPQNNHPLQHRLQHTTNNTPTTAIAALAISGTIVILGCYTIIVINAATH